MNFSGKKVVVTGASRGFGKALARAFRENGAWVIGTKTNKNINLEDDFCNEWFIADFLDIEQIKSCAEFIKATEADVLVNNAGINKISPFVEVSLDDFQSIQQVNVIAPFMFCKAVIPFMLKKGWGRIVNISSIWGKISKEYRASYSASKFALDGMTIAIAAEHSVNGILANCVAPGFFDTELTRNILGEEGIDKIAKTVPAKRLGQVGELTKLILWLASADNTYMSGQNIAIDGGFTRV